MRAYLFSECSARLLSVPLVGYMVGRYDATTSFNLVRIQDATRLHFSRLDEANNPTFCCPLLFPPYAWTTFSIIFASPSNNPCVKHEERCALMFHYWSLKIAQVSSLAAFLLDFWPFSFTANGP